MAPAGDRATPFARDDPSEAVDHLKQVPMPLAVFPPAAIIGIAITGAVAGPVWAIALAAACLTGVGMWVSRITASAKTALLTAVVGVVLVGAAIVYYSMVESDTADRHASSGTSTNLGGVDLTGADLRRINLRDANLRAADFSGACLRAADLRGADLTGAFFAGADVSGTLIDGDTQVSAARDWPTAPPTPSPCDD